MSASPTESERKAKLAKAAKRRRAWLKTPEGRAYKKRERQRWKKTIGGKKSRARYDAGPTARENRREQKYLKKYGITIAQYDKMLEGQNGVCAICQKPPTTVRLAVDHDHGTKRVRGLLCFYCNRHRVGKLTAPFAQRVADYVTSTFDGRKL